MFEPISQSRRKAVASLSRAKERRASGLFVAEGEKAIDELLGAFRCTAIIATSRWLESPRCSEFASRAAGAEFLSASTADMERISSLSTAPQVVGVFEIPRRELRLCELQGELILALDCIQDPGNLGTIIRTANWFGVNTIICSADTVDLYNPKVVQATMGAMGRVEVHYVGSLAQTLAELAAAGVEICGTFLGGEDIYTAPLPRQAVIVMGNEGRGVSPAVAETVTRRLTIPAFAPAGVHVESLNVAIATAITLSQFRRQPLIMTQ